MDHTILTAINVILNFLSIVLLGLLYWGLKKLGETVNTMISEIKDAWNKK